MKLKKAAAISRQESGAAESMFMEPQWEELVAAYFK
jgi:hypothetical protein